MRKTLIIDDRPERIKIHLTTGSLSELNILEKNGLLTYSIGIDPSGDIVKALESFDLIAVHRTYLIKADMLNTINSYINSTKKYLIVFSGGISVNEVINGGHRLNIDASDFYTAKLPRFIYDYGNEKSSLKAPLLQFLHGDSWRLSLLLQYRYILWKHGDKDFYDDEIDRNIADNLQEILWDGNEDISIEEVNLEIEKEKERRINS